MSHPSPVARRMYDLVEPIGLLPYSADEPNEALFALGFTDYWDIYFAARSAPLGQVPPEVVHAILYNFAPGEVARHLPAVWSVTTPAAALAARDLGCTHALRTQLGALADRPATARAADLLTRAAYHPATEGRALYAALRTLPAPDEPLTRLWHAANLLREHRGDGHVVALVGEGVGGLEAHALHALSQGQPAHEFGRIHHLPRAQVDAVTDGMRARGLIGADGWLTEAGRATKSRVEALTDRLAEPAYDALTPDELAELVGALEPIAAALKAASPF